MKNNKLYHFAEIKNLTKDSADLFFYGDIVSNSWGKWTSEDTCPEDVRLFLDSVQEVKTLNVFVNSGGGAVGAGLTIYHMLKRCKAHKIAWVDGIAASICSIIPFGCDEIRIYKDSYMMVHKPWTYSQGNATQLRKDADDLEVIEAGMMAAYETFKQDDVSMETIAELIENETWLTGEMAAKYFKVIVVEDGGIQACASVYYDKYMNKPTTFSASEIIKTTEDLPIEPLKPQQPDDDEAEILALLIKLA